MENVNVVEGKITTGDVLQVATANGSVLGKRKFDAIAAESSSSNKSAKMQEKSVRFVSHEENERQQVEAEKKSEAARKATGIEMNQAPTTDLNSQAQEQAKTAATRIASNLVSALQTVSSATGLTYVCSSIAQPIVDAWLQVRELDKMNDVDRGLLNSKIDKIIASVKEMYKQGTPRGQIRTFVSNSVQLLLFTPIIGMGAGAGLMIGGAGGGAIGALGGAVAGLQFVPNVIIVGDVGPEVLPIAAGAIMAGPMIGAGLGGAYGAGVGAYSGAKAGAKYTSRFLRKPLTTVGEAMNDAGNLPSHIGSHLSSDTMGLNNNNSSTTYVFVN